jgi:cytochrome P450
MSTSQASTGLPPGSTGLPLIGETLAFIKDGFSFISSRIATHGPVFRTRLFGKDAVVMAGPEASAWWADGTRFVRKGATPDFIRRLLGGETLLFIDAEQHRARKQQVLAALTREAITAYLPDMQGSIEAALARLAGAGEVAFVPAARRLAIEVICRTTLGLAPGPDLDAVLADYEQVLVGFTSLPLPIPGTTFARAAAASERLLDRFRSAAARERERPSRSGLGRVLAARSQDGATISTEDACREMYHLVLAGLIVYAELVRLVLALDELPEVRARLTREVDETAPRGPITLEQIHRMRYLTQVVMETKRMTPVIPASLAIARESFAVGGHTVPKGWLVLWSPWHSCRVGGVYTDPDRFDPDRFSPERAEHHRHEQAFVPQGAGAPEGHLCGGVDFSSVLMALFAALLVRGYTVEIPPQDRAYAWRHVPPSPRDGLRLRLHPR